MRGVTKIKQNSLDQAIYTVAITTETFKRKKLVKLSTIPRQVLFEVTQPSLLKGTFCLIVLFLQTYIYNLCIFRTFYHYLLNFDSFDYFLVVFWRLGNNNKKNREGGSLDSML